MVLKGAKKKPGGGYENESEIAAWQTTGVAQTATTAGAASGSVTDNAIFEDSGGFAEALRKFNKRIAKVEESCAASAIEVKATSQEVDRLNDCISRMEDFANGLGDSIIIRGLAEIQEDTPRGLLDQVAQIYGDCSLNVQRIISVRRVGKPNPDRPRLVMVKFQSEEAKLERNQRPVL
eukprot:gene17056-23351_t